LVEILKQANNSPIPFYKQVVLVYAWINWYLDTIDIHKIQKIEQNLYAKMDSSYKTLADTIRDKQELTPEIEKQIQELIHETIKQI
jgi:F-type H+-transporting ATPase subunit alpha